MDTYLANHSPYGAVLLVGSTLVGMLVMIGYVFGDAAPRAWRWINRRILWDLDLLRGRLYPPETVEMIHLNGSASLVLERGSNNKHLLEGYLREELRYVLEHLEYGYTLDSVTGSRPQYHFTGYWMQQLTVTFKKKDPPADRAEAGSPGPSGRERVRV